MNDSPIVISTITIILALAALVFAWLTGRTMVRLLDRTDALARRYNERLSENTSTEFLDRRAVDDNCDICFGEFKNGDVAVCTCGMKFHKECAEMTEECPYCKSRFGTMSTRAIIRPICPGCGALLEKSICPRCGTVLPNKDMTFRCICGEIMLAADRVCGTCGAEYEFTYEPEKHK